MRLTVTLLAATALTVGALYAYSNGTRQVDLPASAETTPSLAGSPVFARTGAAPLIDFSGVQARLGGEPTRVLVLGTPHLDALPEAAFTPDHLDLLVRRLGDWSPDIIAIEAVGGRTCDTLRRYGNLYPGVADGYCHDPAPALDSLQMGQPDAALAVLTTLSEWPDQPTAGDRRQLALRFFGAGEPWSAALQWSRLDPDERIAADGVTDALRERLDSMLTSRNENNLIALRLARVLDLEQLAAMDDHSADFIQVLAPPELGPVIQSVWQADHPLDADMAAARETYIGSAGAVLDGYRFLNSEPYQRYVIEGDFGRAAATPDEQAVARQYVAWWQVRGLRMAANVVEAAGNQPGARVLVIVGASHKAYFDAYLDQMHDIELVSVEAVLADPETGEDAP
ncbi:DUF5694 domain-containing protein [Maricaulis sp.]|uniref:DUF5694 domain-containing protein n=1 Tax=Maricaulis sp. TaxID=1486257 RepID=UPI002B2696EC|nr:DUF5694 domain-containing protein [Maricaulis sp.]